MKDIVLYYFTGTGNTARAANTFRNIMENRGVKVTLRELNSGSKADVEGYKTLGLFYPVYGLSIPPVIRTFLNNLPKGEGRQAFILANAHTNTGLTRKKAAGILRKKGYTVIGADEIHMPTSGIITAETEPEDRAEEMRVCADSDTETYAEQLLAGNAPVEYGSLSGKEKMVAAMFSLVMPRAAVKKIAVDNNCKGCGFCASVCPSGNITIENGKPVWGKNCEVCLRCLNFCPNTAIQLMGSPGRRRYREPGFQPTVR